MMIKNELGFWSGKFMRVLDGSTISRMPIAFSMGAHGGMNKICVDYLALGVGKGHLALHRYSAPGARGA